MDTMFKLKSIALFVSAALLVPGVYAANGTVRNTTTIDDHSVISSFTEVISGDSLIVDGSAVFNYESTYALPGAIYIYGNADLGNGSK